MILESKHITRIQSFLFAKGFIQEKPSDTWTPHKSSGYKTYLESKGLPESECREVPYNLGMLTHELRDFILIPEKVNVVDSGLLDEDSEDENLENSGIENSSDGELEGNQDEDSGEDFEFEDEINFEDEDE